MITDATFDAVEAFIAKNGIDTDKVRQLRQDLGGDLTLTYCMDDDVCGPKPIREYDTFNLYLVDASDHCISFTPSIEAATGLVIAEVEPEDD
ncbi:MAG: hypothetical protein ACPGOV_16975 [Magnetovibrionaceae bacterium]